MPSPIIIFVYNRALLARQALLSLMENSESRDSELYIFSDGPEDGADKDQRRKIADVREVIRSKDWCGKVHITEREKNLGLAASVIEGVSEVIRKHGKVIVIEDDVILSRYFLNFMNKCLDIYENNDKILSVGSWNYFFSPDQIKDDQFFFRYPDSKGWGTFARAWNLFEHDAAVAERKLLESGKMAHFNGAGGLTYYEDMLQQQIRGEVNSWAIRWTATSVINDMLNVFPGQTLSKNAGFGSDSTHEKDERDYNRDLVLCDRELAPDPGVPVSENIAALQARNAFVARRYAGDVVPDENDLVDRIKTPFHRLKVKIKHNIAGKITDHRRRNLSEEDRLIHEAADFPRYQITNFRYRDYRIKTGDFLSVAYQIKECFGEQKLKFSTDKPNPVIVDCGANVGITVLYFKKLFPNAKIFAYEPDQDIYRYLLGNLENNHVIDVDTVNKAVWTNDKGVEFGSDGADGGSVFRKENSRIVPTVRLRDVLESLALIDFLKIDIEGAESFVLSDCSSVLRKVNNIFIEYHSFYGEPQKMDEILSVLRKNGFRYYISNVGAREVMPYMRKSEGEVMDLLLDIYAVREKQ